MSTTFSMKAAVTDRVNPTMALRLFDESRQLGNPIMCGNSAKSINVDEFGRPQGGAGYRLLELDDAACSSFVYPLRDRMLHENYDRPMLGPYQPGQRGYGDLMFGGVRDNYPQNIYMDINDPYRGSFNPTQTKILAPIDSRSPSAPYNTTYTPDLTRPLTINHNALNRTYY
jgi:hypothetical protein